MQRIKRYTQAVAMAILLLVTACKIKMEDKQAQAEAVLAKIQQFQEQHHRLPQNLTEMGLPETETGPIYYDKKTDDQYILWYGTELGTSRRYDSAEGEWKNQ
jgi:hypothetical protein